MQQTRQAELTIPAGEVQLPGNLALPPGCRMVVVFAHGSGSSRFSPRNRFVAEVLNDGGLGTLLFDLLTPREEARDELTAELRFDIPFLARRLIAVTDWLVQQPDTGELHIGYFGASTGAAAALIAAAERPGIVKAVVSRGGRPDLAANALPRVTAPTLLIVGGRDTTVLELNEWALRQMKTEARLEVVPGATHLFEEPGALEQVARLALQWFLDHGGRAD